MEYIVSTDNEESNPLADTLSVTGRVNGSQCAAKLRLSRLVGLTPAKRKAAIQRALAEAFASRASSPASAAGDRVVL